MTSPSISSETATAPAPPAETQLDRLVRRIHSLYSLPAVALEVVQLTRNPNSDATTLTQCLQRDPALVAKILKAVNSSLYGLPQSVANLQQGLALLGSRPLQLLVLGFSLPPDLLKVKESKALTRFWHLSLVRAVAAKEIARRWYRLPADEPFLAGLLQDLGLLALIKELGSPYIRFLEAADEEELDLESAELSALGFDHRSLAARLLGAWGLPESIVAAIGAGRRLETLKHLTSHRELAEVCHLADLLARLLVTRQPGVLSELLDACKAHLDLKLADIQSLVDGMQATVYDVAKALSVELPEGQSYEVIIREAHERMSRLLAGEEVFHGPSEESSLLAGLAELSAATRGSLVFDGDSAKKEKTASQPPRTTDVGSLAILPLVTKSAMRCRQRRQPLSLLMMRVNRLEELLLLASGREIERLFSSLQASLRRKHAEAGHQEAMHIVKQGNEGFACVCENVDRHQVVELARRAMLAIEDFVEEECENLSGQVSLCAGAASVGQLAKNPPAQRLIDAAARCLAAAATLECNSVKSIDVL